MNKDPLNGVASLDFNPLHFAQNLLMKALFFLTSLWIISTPLLLAASTADSLLANYEMSIDSAEKADLAIRLSREYNRMPEKHPQAFDYAHRAVELADGLNNPLLLAQGLDNLGLLYRYNQQYAQAIPLHRRAYLLMENLPDVSSYKMRFANNVGVAARYDQDHVLAVEYYLKALGIAQAENDLRNIAISSNGLGNSLSYLDPDSQEAMRHFRRALQAERDRGNQRGTAMNLLSIASYHTRLGNYDQALTILNELLTINQQINDTHGLAITYEYFGHNYLEEALQPNQAKNYYQQSLNLFKALNNRQKMADLKLNLGQTAELTQQPSEARAHYQQALAIAEEEDHKGLIVAASQHLSRLNEGAGNYRLALAYNKKAEAYNDSLDLIHQQSIIQGLQMQYDFGQKENEIQLLRANQETREAELFAQQERFKRERLLYSAAFLVLLSITSLIILTLRNLNLKKNIRLQEEEQKRERLKQEYQRNLWQAEILASRMQMNPHFLFNCLNSVKFLIQQQHNREAIKYLTTLSKFMRELLQTGKMQSIPLMQELELAQKYIHLEAIRFDQQLDFQLDMQEMDATLLDGIAVPPMVLQPFIENAIWHGLVPSPSANKKLNIHLNIMDNKLVISIEDNGVGRQHKKNLTGTTHKSMGVEITEDRIALFNKINQAHLQVQTEDLLDDGQQPSGTRVNLQISINNPEPVAQTW